MRRAIGKWSLILGTCSLLILAMPGGGFAQTLSAGDAPRCVGIARVGASPVAARVAPQRVHQDAATGATFFFSSTSDGAIRVSVQTDGLGVEKTVRRDGQSRISLSSGADVVSVAIGRGVIDVERSNGHRRSIDAARASEDEWLDVKVLLAGSKALRLFRSLVSSLDARTLKTPGGAALVLSDAVLGHLDGDVGAIGRLQQQMRTAVQARIRPARTGAVAEEADCWHTYENETMHAMNDYDSCKAMYAWYDPRQAACLTVWTLQAEVAWAELISCAGLRLTAQH